MKYLLSCKSLLWLFVLGTINTEASSIVLFDFKSQNIPDTEVKEFSKHLRNKLGETSIVLGEEEMKYLLESNGKQLEKCNSKDSIIEFRKILNAQELIWGTVVKDSKRYIFNITLIRFIENRKYDKKKMQFSMACTKLTKCINEIVRRIFKETPERLFNRKGHKSKRI